MEIVEVKDRATLDSLYDDGALTFEGMYPDAGNVADIFRWLKSITPVKQEVAYHIKGGKMNREYGLTGDNSYRDDLSILCFRMDDMERPEAIITPRLLVGGRWFSDVVDNNARREGEGR